MRKSRLIIAAVIALVTIIGYMSQTKVNPVTGEKQRIAVSADDEIALGLQAAPELAEQFGGPSRDTRAQQLLDRIGRRLVEGSDAARSPYRFEFHLLDDDRVINAFALPGGQIFMTEALARELKSESQIAGVIAHEIGHVVGRHGAEQLSRAQLIQGLGGAAVIGMSDPDNPGGSRQNQMLAMAVGQLVNMKYGRGAELESDRLGVRYMGQSGYDPNSLIHVMKVLERAGGARKQPEFFSTHPNPGNRIEQIKQAIREEFPDGVPNGMRP